MWRKYKKIIIGGVILCLIAGGAFTMFLLKNNEPSKIMFGNKELFEMAKVIDPDNKDIEFLEVSGSLTAEQKEQLKNCKVFVTAGVDQEKWAIELVELKKTSENYAYSIFDTSSLIDNQILKNSNNVLYDLSINTEIDPAQIEAFKEKNKQALQGDLENDERFFVSINAIAGQIPFAGNIWITETNDEYENLEFILNVLKKNEKEDEFSIIDKKEKNEYCFKKNEFVSGYTLLSIQPTDETENLDEKDDETKDEDSETTKIPTINKEFENESKNQSESSSKKDYLISVNNRIKIANSLKQILNGDSLKMDTNIKKYFLSYRDMLETTQTYMSKFENPGVIYYGKATTIVPLNDLQIKVASVYDSKNKKLNPNMENIILYMQENNIKKILVDDSISNEDLEVFRKEIDGLEISVIITSGDKLSFEDIFKENQKSIRQSMVELK